VAGSLRRPSSASSPVSSAARVIAGQLPKRTASSICENLRNLRINQGQKSASRRRYNNHTTLPIATGKSPSISADYADFHRLRPTCSARVPVARSRCRKRRRPSSASSPVSSAARVIAGPLPKRTASSICENLRNLRINQGQKSASRRRYNNHTTLPIATGKSPSISADYADFHRLRPTCSARVPVARSRGRKLASAEQCQQSCQQRCQGYCRPVAEAHGFINLRNLRINQGQKSASRRLCQQSHDLARHDREKFFNIRRLRRFPQITTDLLSAGAGGSFSLPEACVGRAVPAVLSAALPGLLPARCPSQRKALHPRSPALCRPMLRA
jgi:hypothetical protein